MGLCADEPAFASPLLGPAFARLVGGVRSDAAVAVVRRRGVGLAYFAHHRRPGGVARPIGAPFSDLHGVISGPGLPLSGPELLRGAGIRRFPFTALVDPYRLFEGTESGWQTSYAIDLTDPTPVAGRGRHAKKMRRWRARLEADIGPLSLTMPDQDPASFETLLNWKRAQFNRTGLHDVLRPDWSRALMAQAFSLTEPPLRGLLAVLRAGGRPIAGRFGVEGDGIYHPWLAAYDPAMAAYGPGHLLLSAILEAAGRLPLRAYELGSGLDEQKRSISNRSMELPSGEARADGAVARRPAGGRLLRLGRRLDQIATVELTLSGRAYGLADTLAKARRRWSAG